MYYVKVQGESIADLKEGLERHLRELSGVINSKATVAVTTNVTTAPDEEEMEEVASPYAHHTPSVPPSIPKDTVVDNEVDSEGLPWDSRIHASSKNKVTNGTWRTRRNVDENLVYQVKQELRARVASAQVPMAEMPPVIVTPVAQPEPTLIEAPPVIASAAQAPTPAPLPQMNHSGHTLDTFKTNFPLILANLITEKKIDQNYVNTLKEYFGVTEIWMVNDEQKAMMFDQFVNYGFVQRIG